MAYTLTARAPGASNLTAKNRVWDFFEYPNKPRPANRRNPQQPRRKIRPTATKTASGIPYWPSRDPIGEQGGMNLYGFVGNDGISMIDLLGNTSGSTWIHATKSRVGTEFQEYGWNGSGGVNSQGRVSIGFSWATVRMTWQRWNYNVDLEADPPSGCKWMTGEVDTGEEDMQYGEWVRTAGWIGWGGAESFSRDKRQRTLWQKKGSKRKLCCDNL